MNEKENDEISELIKNNEDEYNKEEETNNKEIS